MSPRPSLARSPMRLVQLDGPPELVAPMLLGVLLVRDGPAGCRGGRIVEVEAYGGPEDRASHARFGPTPRNRTMFGAAGRAYVYGVYGMHQCLNVVIGPTDTPAAILIRAVEPITGVAAMRAARVERAVATRRADALDPAAAAARLARVGDALVASGPANLAAAFGITGADDGVDLLDRASHLRLEVERPDASPLIVAGATAPVIANGPRVGVAYAGPEWAGRPWRFWLAGNPAVSGRR